MKTNHLINEKSPYLLQHAHNPVNWYPWGDEAFAIAKKENKPVFLSIGYSTCHWCHVFAHESFEDPQIADYLNEHYIAVKVDREERPDIDAVYMKVCQMMTGHGGWPLSIFMTPDKVPFYAGTYFPRSSQYGMPGFMDVLTQLHDEYSNDQQHIEKVTKSVTDALNRAKVVRGQHRLSSKNTIQAYQLLEERFDSVNGGIGAAPKFPAPQNILFLLHFYHMVGKKDALRMAEKTLTAMAAGGIYDHIGFGFSRYSTDTKWLVPHFEKMLYDNALLIICYTECYQITKNEKYRIIAEQIIQFVLREMKNPEGGFYSAIDADSEGAEGKYYSWEYNEILQVLGKETGLLFASAYNITPDGNFEGKNIPNQIGVDLKQLAAANGMQPDALHKKLAHARKQLLTEREKRVCPHVDDKVLTSWNAMMIAALAKAGGVFGEETYINLAKENLVFIENTLIQDGRIMARYRDGDVKFNGYLDDYAYLVWAYNEMHAATYNLDYLNRAKETADNMTKLFWDSDQGGFFFSGTDNEALLSREKEIFDGALPSGNGVAAVNLARLGYLTGETRYLDQVSKMYYAFYEEATYNVAACSHFMQSLLLTEVSAKEVVIIGNDTQLKDRLRKTFTPNIMAIAAHVPEQFGAIAPFASQYKIIQDQPTYYVCEKFTCQQPTNDPDKAWKLMNA